MKQWTKMILFVIGIILMFSNCKNENFDNFYENEKASLINAANEILLKLGLENFEVIIYTHRSINNRVVSKDMSDTNWNGSNFSPESCTNNDGVVFGDMSNVYGYMRQRTLTANYESNAKREIVYDNFSIIIIIENITQGQKNELLKLFDSYLLNIERGDTIFIISKDEFNNFE